MDTNRIRRTFLEFFEAREHTIVPSASLIPVDPTLLLTNAGMVPFKPYMLGESTPPYPRAASVQKCARTGDIDIVGTTARHLTFFEMLGNFSFGDYFKEKAIPWSFALATEGFGLDPDRLWFTVHETDKEAEEIWIETVGVRPERVQRRDRDNFWQMGVPGPCGPSSEIFYDKGPAYGPDGGPVVDEERFVEFWNLVFMQNVQDEPYHVVGDLPARNIDTGAGLERVAVVLQDVETVFDTDLLRPIVAAAEGATGVGLGEREGADVSLRIMADHGRAVTFLIADRVVPSNEGRGYVLRRLLRRAVRHGFLLGAEDLVLPRLIAATVDVMGDAYPELVAQHDAIAEMAEREEVRFRRTLQSGHQLLDQELEAMEPGEVFSGATAFKLHDTYGFPRELTEEILTERGIRLDIEEFHRMMEEQRERARRHFRGGDEAARADASRTLLRGIDGTTFVGYEAEGSQGRILAIVREGELVEQAEAGQEIELFLDRTPFYAESGGQVGDRGTVTTATGRVSVADTQYAVPGIHGHRGTVTAGQIAAGQDATAEVDHDRRERIRKNHTGTHLLHWALREVVGSHVHQAGSLVAPDRLRFDFSHFHGLAPEELLEVEHEVNARVVENATVTTLETSKDEAEDMGALAFFGDKYGDRVRVVKAGDYSTEFCGGTHVPSTGQIGPVIVLGEASVAANTRRVEALTGLAAYEHLADLRRQLEQIAGQVRAQPGQVVAGVDALLTRIDAQEERIARFEAQARSSVADDLLAQAESFGTHKLVVAARPDTPPADLRTLAFQLRDRLGSGIGVLGAAHDGKAGLLVFVSPDLVADGVSAGTIVRAGAAVVGGGGSPDPELAQAGGPHGDRVPDAVEEAAGAAREALRQR
jgi:alanyl-tRNA synthetase